MQAAMEYSEIEYSVEAPVATVTLSRPERLNAFTLRMLDELLDALDRIDAHDEVRAAIFTGRGRAFCAGSDLSGGAETFDRGEPQPFEMSVHADGGGVLARRLLAARKPIIAAINGPAVGIGITMTLAMDLRLMAETARAGFVFVRRGLVPESCSSWLLPRLVGMQRALEWVYTGRLFDADEALRGGLVRSLHPPDELIAAARTLALEIAAGSAPVAVAVSRRLLWEMLGEEGPAVAHRRDSEAMYALGGSDDAREGIDAFLAKREPRFPLRVAEDLPGLGLDRGAAG